MAGGTRQIYLWNLLKKEMTIVTCTVSVYVTPGNNMYGNIYGKKSLFCPEGNKNLLFSKK